MKLKNILGIAISALLFTACAEDDPIGTLDSVTVDKTFVTMPMTENSATVTVTAASDWKLENLYSVELPSTDRSRSSTILCPSP